MADGIRVFIDSSGMRRRLDAVRKNQQTEIGKSIRIAAEVVRSDAVKSIQSGSRSGRTYTTEFWTDPSGQVRPGRERTPHQASAPGEAPKTDTGSLVGSIFAEVKGSRDRPLGFVGTDILHGIYLEFGTQNMGARPWLHPAFQRQLPNVKRILLHAFRRANRRS